MEEDREIAYTLRVKKSIWEKFKDITPRSKNLNTAINELIEKEVKKITK